jgi:Fe-S cluster biogenesis protein NfuA
METTKVPITIYAEVTPNPSVMKFVANKMLVEGEALEFRNIEEARPSPLAYQLFHFPFIREIFISCNFIALTKFDVIDWEEVTLELREFIRNWLHEGRDLIDENALKAAQNTEDSEEAVVSIGAPAIELPNLDSLGDIEKRIVDILDDYVAPAVAQDGGQIRFAGYKDKVVQVLLQGACNGCPSSTATLQQGIKNILQKMLPTLVDDVQAING